MYGKLFATMYDGTLGTRGPWQALVTFQQLIILADQDGIVDMTPEAIARRTTIPLEIITKGLAMLEQPDPDSRTPDEEGRRIVRLSDTRSWGWRIVNYGRYRAIRTAEERRSYMRSYQRARRAKVAVNTVNRVSTRSTNSSKQMQEASKPPSAGKPAPTEFEQVWKALPRRAGNNPRARAERAWRARLADGCTQQEMLAGAERYSRFCTATGKTGTEYVMQAATFLGPEKPFAQPWTIATGGPRWHETDDGILSKARELGISTRGETAETLKAQIRERLGATP